MSRRVDERFEGRGEEGARYESCPDPTSASSAFVAAAAADECAEYDAREHIATPILLPDIFLKIIIRNMDIDRVISVKKLQS